MKGIKLPNGHVLRYVVASGALGFNGLGYFWERPLVLMGIIKPELFTVILKTLTLEPRKGNLCWWKPWTWLPFSPWSCVRFLPGGGVVNKVGLTNNGFDDWERNIAPWIDFEKYDIIVSIWGTEEECVKMARRLEKYRIVAIEWNDSCPNTGHGLSGTQASIRTAKAIKAASKHPLIYKGSAAQDCLTIARELEHTISAFNLNSIPLEMIYPNGDVNPLRKLEAKLKRLTGNGGGGGGVSGKPAQEQNWGVVLALANQGLVPVIGPSVMSSADVIRVAKLGARAAAFGSVHIRTPSKPTTIVKAFNAAEKKAGWAGDN